MVLTSLTSETCPVRTRLGPVVAFGATDIRYRQMKMKMSFYIAKHGSCCDLHTQERDWARIKAGGNKFARSGHSCQDNKDPQQIPPGIDPLLAGTCVTDIELDKLYGEDHEVVGGEGYTTFSDINLDHDEISVLKRRPEFAIYDSLDRTKLREEMNLALTKVRWDRRSRDDKDQDSMPDPSPGSQEEKLKLAQEEEDRMEDAKSRLIYHDVSNTVNMGARRATDMRHNQRLHLPQPRPPSEEAVLGARLEVWVGASDKYVADNCLPGGAPKTHNMDAASRIGLTKLKKRVQAGDIVVIPADKGSQFTVSSQESFARQGASHTTKDSKISHKQLDQIQARMNALSRGLAKVSGIGACWGEKNTARCWNNLTSDSCVAPLLYPSPKVHKPMDSIGDPK